MKMRRTILVASLLILTGCQAHKRVTIERDRGERPAPSKEQVVQVLESFLWTARYSSVARRWINEQTEFVFSQPRSFHWGVRNMSGTRLFEAWRYCVTIVNPPKITAGEVSTGAITVVVRQNEVQRGEDQCHWFAPPQEYLAEVEAAKSRQAARTAAN